ncbi:hypothetical protein ABPG72_008324 [Tetrahymena utriculariae]
MEQDYQKKLYSQLLEQIQSKDHYDSNLKQFLKQLSVGIEQESLLNLISLQLDNKSVYFIRHAESKYNQWREQSSLNWSIFYKNTLENIDPELTEKGQQQTKNLQLSVLKEYENLTFDAVYVSPLSRAINTFGYLAYKENNEIIYQFKFAKVLACHYLRERLDTCGDIGKSLEVVKEGLCKKWNIDSCMINSDQWWCHKQFDNQKQGEMFKQKTEDFDKIQRRLIIILLMIIFSDDKYICLVSHSNIYKCLKLKNQFQSHDIKNAQMKILDKQAIMKFLTKTIPKHIYQK